MGSVLDAVPIGGLRFDSGRIVRAMVLDATTVQLLGSDGMVLPNGQFKAVYKTDWQGQQLQYSSARTNLALWSQDFTNVAWIKLNAGTGVLPVVTPAYATGPDGVAGSASRVQFDCGVGVTIGDYSIVRQLVTPMLGVRKFWVKSNTGANQYLHLHTGFSDTAEYVVTTAWAEIYFNETTVASYIGFGKPGYVTHSSNTADILVFCGDLKASSINSSYIPTTTVAVTVTDYSLAGNTVTLSVPLIAGAFVSAVPTPFLNAPALG